jgi:hypothetical protein
MPEKYHLVPRFARGNYLFEDGREPLQTLNEINRLRGRLVHPKPELGENPMPPLEDEDPAFSSVEVARYISRTAEAARTLTRNMGLEVDSWLDYLLKHQGDLQTYASWAKSPPPK